MRKLLVLLLVLVFFMLSFPFSEKKITGGVSVSPNAYSELLRTYKDAEKEVPLCIFGKEEKIIRTESPTVHSSTDSTTTFSTRKCEAEKNFIGVAHNHFGKKVKCGLSNMDRVQWFLNDEINLQVLACKDDFGNLIFKSFKFSS